MLRELKIKNFAIIENLSVEFHEGLNVLTGETGAGKSIIIDALNLILGGRADTDSIRSSEDSASVEALIQVNDPETLRMVSDLGIDTEEDGQLIIKRVLSHSGKNRTYINGSNITVAALAKVGNRLVDIHGQHDHQALLHPESHVDLLDLYGNLMEVRNSFVSAYEDYQAKVRTLEQMNSSESERLQRQDLLNFQIGEIDKIDPQQGEEENLKTDKNKLRHAEKLSQSLHLLQNLLANSDGAVLEQLGKVNNELERLPEIDPALEAQAKRGQNAFYELQELTEELRDYLQALEFNPSRLEEIEDRLAELNGLKRKYGNDISAVLDYRVRIAEELETLSGNREQMDALKAELEERQKKLSALAAGLAEKREKVGKHIKQAVEKQLQELNMKHVQFEVGFQYPPDPDGFARFRDQTVRISPVGIGSIEFLFSPNPGEDLKPLAKIISGGELSRVMLALKTILNEQDQIPVMVFDEVDSGISGKVAEQVGVKLKKISKSKQVFCITHLPQIAGMANVHYLVHKTVAGKRTRSVIDKLEYEERVEEIARMSGGETITQTTLEHAKEMIKTG